MGVIVVLIAIVAAIFLVVAMITRSSARAKLAISCWWQDQVEPLFRPERELDGLRLQKEILRLAVPASTVMSVSGELRVIPKIAIEVSERDWSVLEYSPLGFDQVLADLETELSRRLDGKAVASPKPIRLELIMAPWARVGRPRVSRSTDSTAFATQSVSQPGPQHDSQTESQPGSTSAQRPVRDPSLPKTVAMPPSDTTSAMPSPQVVPSSIAPPSISPSISPAISPAIPPATRPASAVATVSPTRAADPIPKTRPAPPMSPADLRRPVVAIESTELSVQAKLIPTHESGRPVDFAKQRHSNQDGRRCWTLGRGNSIDIQAEHPEVSNAHTQFTLAAGVWRVRDLDSTNGTFLNGEQVTDSELLSGDQIRLGPNGPGYLFEINRLAE